MCCEAPLRLCVQHSNFSNIFSHQKALQVSNFKPLLVFFDTIIIKKFQNRWLLNVSNMLHFLNLSGAGQNGYAFSLRTKVPTETKGACLGSFLISTSSTKQKSLGSFLEVFKSPKGPFFVFVISQEITLFEPKGSFSAM